MYFRRGLLSAYLLLASQAHAQWPAAVNTFNTRTGQVTLSSADVIAALTYTPFNAASNLPVTNLNSGTGASSSTYWRGDGTWATPSAGITSFNTRTGPAITLTEADVAAALALTPLPVANGGTGQTTTSPFTLSPSSTFTGNFSLSITGTGGSGTSTIPNTSDITADLATYAPLASPTLTGAPKAPTQTAGDTSTDIATDAFVSTAVGAPSSTATCNGALALTYPTATYVAAEYVTVTGNCTLSLSGGTANQLKRLEVYINENSTGGYSITVPSGVGYAGSTPTLSTTANASNYLIFNTPNGGTNNYGSGGTFTNPFVGVADKESTISLYWGTAAASAAIAASGIAAVDLSDNTNTCTGVHLLSTGYLDTTVGTYCTGTRTVAAVCAADGGSACSGGIMRITKFYQQIGATSAPITFASYAVSPYFILSGWNSKPMAACASSASMTGTATITTAPIPFVIGMSFAQYANFTTTESYIGANATDLNNTGAVNIIAGQATGGATNVTAAATNATSLTDFTLSHGHRVSFAVNGAGTSEGILVDGGSQSTATISFGDPTGTSISICSNAGFNYSDIMFSSLYIDPTAATVATQQSATGVSLP